MTINYISDSSAASAAVVAQKIQADGGRAMVVRAAVDEDGAKLLVEETFNVFETDHIDILSMFQSLYLC